MTKAAGSPKRENLTEKYLVEKDKFEMEFQEFLERNKHTALMIFDRAKEYGDRAELHHKPYGTWETISWKQLAEQMYDVSSALLELGLREEQAVGIFSPNRAEWHIADLGALSIRDITVPIYPTNTTSETEYIVNDAEIRVLFVGRQMQYDRAYELLDKCPTLENIVVFHRDTKIHASDKRVIMWEDFLAMGRNASHAKEIEDIHARCHYDDNCTIIYTSGTTGEPKGAIHTHKSLFHNSWSVGGYPQGGLSDDDSTLAMLPLSHVLERSWNYGVMQMGGHIYYCEDHNEILEYMEEAATSVMNGAPRLFEKIYSTIYSGVEKASPLKKKLFHWATGVGEKAGSYRYHEKTVPLYLRLKYAIAYALVLKKVRGLFGKNMHHVNVGGAPLNPEIQRFFFNCGVIITPGYGLTETAPVIAMNGVHCLKFGSVGPLTPLAEARIDPETGEIQAKGPNIFKEYYKKADKTKEAFTDDGWFRTGDVGYFDEDGYLFITDRIKDLIITAGGKNIAPQMIETLLTEDLYIEYAAIIGDARKYLSALIVPSFDALEDWAKKRGLEYSSREDLVENDAVREFYWSLIEARQKDLGRVEQIKRFTLLPREFSQEEGEITPTMKVKRKVVEKKFADVIEGMYKE